MGHPLSPQLVEDGFHTATIETEVAQGGQRIRTVCIACTYKFLSPTDGRPSCCGRRTEGGILAHFVLQVDENALRRLGANALHRLERVNITAGDHLDQLRRSETTQDHPGRLGADAAHAGQHHEEPALGVLGKPEQQLGILAVHRMNENLGLRLARQRRRRVQAEVDEIKNDVDMMDKMVKEFLDFSKDQTLEKAKKYNLDHLKRQREKTADKIKKIKRAEPT